MSIGSVWLVGAGPGDPGLITVRGLALLRAADVIVYDRLVAAELLREAKTGAVLIYAGKEPGAHSMTQEAINATLVREARAGRAVVRLKGGDPFVFGRGGEEALALRAAGIPFDVVPGISSAFAGPAAAGIPVTHRGTASSVYIGSPAAGDGIDWTTAARADTCVLLMAVEQLAETVAALIAHAKAPSTPAAVIEDATLPSQRTVIAPLSQIAREVERAGIRPPAVVVVGEVVRLSATLSAHRPAAIRPGADATNHVSTHV